MDAASTIGGSAPRARRGKLPSGWFALGVCLGLSGVCDAIGVAAYMLHDGPIHVDFFGMWSWARFETERPPAQIYDHAAQHAFLLSLDPQIFGKLPCAYPPSYLLLIRPLGWLSYPVAHAVWSAATFLAYVVAVCGWRWRSRPMLVVVLASATAVNLFYGQNGFLTAALLVGGARLAPSRPVLGGILLGLLSYKPQFGPLVAIALFAGGLWRAALVTGLTVGATVVASVLALGIEPWIAWARAMPEFVTMVAAARAHLLHLSATVLSNALALGVGERLAGWCQAVATAASAVAVWTAFCRGSGRLAVAVLAMASVVASPYAYLYDLTLVVAAVSLVVAEGRAEPSLAEASAMGAAVLMPAGMLMDVVPPLAAGLHCALLGLLLLRVRRDVPESLAFTGLMAPRPACV